jgi:hypothetical protein
MSEKEMTDAEVVAFLYDVCELYEDEDLDPDNVSEVVKRAFMSSNCDDFAWLLSEITGWQTERMTFTIPERGFGHHTMVRSPEGQLLDIRGWTDEQKTRRYFKLKDEVKANFNPSPPHGADWTDPDDDGFKTMLAALKSRKVAPFNSKEFKAKIADYESSLQPGLKI